MLAACAKLQADKERLLALLEGSKQPLGGAGRPRATVAATGEGAEAAELAVAHEVRARFPAQAMAPPRVEAAERAEEHAERERRERQLMQQASRDAAAIEQLAGDNAALRRGAQLAAESVAKLEAERAKLEAERAKLQRSLQAAVATQRI